MGYLVDANGKFINSGGKIVFRQPVTESPPTPPPSQGTILQTNLQAHFHAGDSASYGGTGTTWSDLTTNNNDLTLTNGPTHVTSPVSAFDFDGANDLANGGDVLDWGTGDITIGIWMNADTVTAGYQYIQSKSARGNSASRYGCGINNAAPFFFVMTTDTGDGSMIWTGSSNVTISTWHYLTFTTNRANSQVNMYIDGSPITESGNAAAADLDRTEGENINSTFPFWIGGTPNSDGVSNFLPFNGKVAELHWYNARLSDAQVLSNYNETKIFYT